MGGCSEAVVDGKSGFVVKPGDINMLADKIISLLADPALQKRMGEQGRALFLERFSLDKFTEEHFNVYAGN
jgi:phosphatidylinositol alpha-1,6-mannosyltransferase